MRSLLQIMFMLYIADNTFNATGNQPKFLVAGLKLAQTCQQQLSSSSTENNMDEYNSQQSCQDESIMAIQEFLSKDENDDRNNDHDTREENPNPSSSSQSFIDNFHFHGWRWHTLSIVRDSSRLSVFARKCQSLLQKNDDNNMGKLQQQRLELQKAVDHVIDFNLKGLQRIEGNVFFPWLKEKLTNNDMLSQYNQREGSSDSGSDSDSDSDSASDNSTANLSAAFKVVIDNIEADKEKVVTIAENIKQQANKINTDTNNINMDIIKEATEQISQQSQSLTLLMNDIFEKELTLLAPAVAKLVPAKEQIKVNNQILRNLGILESRAILVGMSEALKDEKYGTEEERELFEREIPFLPRKMITRWKRTLYDQQAGMLES